MCEKCYEGDSNIRNRQIIFREASILRRVNYGVYICTCSVRSDEYKCKTKHVFFYSNFKPFHQSKYYGAIIDNRADAPIFVLEDNDRETKLNFKYALKTFFGGLCNVENF